jgi:hypothetical protein
MQVYRASGLTISVENPFSAPFYVVALIKESKLVRRLTDTPLEEDSPFGSESLRVTASTSPERL